MAWPALDPGRLLKAVSDGSRRGMTVLDRTRLIDRLSLNFWVAPGLLGWGAPIPFSTLDFLGYRLDCLIVVASRASIKITRTRPRFGWIAQKIVQECLWGHAGVVLKAFNVYGMRPRPQPLLAVLELKQQASPTGPDPVRAKALWGCSLERMLRSKAGTSLSQ